MNLITISSNQLVVIICIIFPFAFKGQNFLLTEIMLRTISFKSVAKVAEFDADHKDNITTLSWPVFYIGFGIVAPVLEEIAFRLIPIGLLVLFHLKGLGIYLPVCLISCTLFALVHRVKGVPILFFLVVYGFGAFLWFSLLWFLIPIVGLWKGFVVIALLHMMHNMVFEFGILLRERFQKINSKVKYYNEIFSKTDSMLKTGH